MYLLVAVVFTILIINAHAFTTGQAAVTAIGQADLNSGSSNPNGELANSLNNPYAVTFDTSGDMWVSDTQNNRVLEFIPPFYNNEDAAVVLGCTDFLGTNCGGTTSSTFYQPEGLAFDSSGNLWVVDEGNNRVLEFLQGNLMTGGQAAIALGEPNLNSGGGGTSSQLLSTPTAIAFDGSGDLWVVDEDNSRVLEFLPGNFATGKGAAIVIGQPKFSDSASDFPGTANTLNFPTGIAFDGSGNLWVADQSNSRVLEYLPGNFMTNGHATNVIGCTDLVGTGCGASTSPTTLSNPYSVTFDSSNNLWVGDGGNYRVLEFLKGNLITDDGSAAIAIGQSSLYLVNSGTSSTAIQQPYGIAIDPSGNLWIADEGNSRVLEYLGNPPYAPPSNPILSLTNTFIDQGQSIPQTASVSNGNDLYTYNYLIVNSITPSIIIANQLYTNVANRANTFVWTPQPNLYIANTFEINVIITEDSPYTNSVNTIYTPIGYNSAPSITINSISNTLVDSSQYTTFTINVVGGTGSFDAELYNVTGSKAVGSVLVTIAGGRSATNTIQVFSPTNNNKFTYEWLAYDQGTTAPYSFSAISNSITVNAFNPYTIPSITASQVPLVKGGQLEIFTASFTGGIGPFTYNYNIFNSVTLVPLANYLVVNSFNSNTFTWVVPLTDAGNTVRANVVITDSATTNSILSLPNLTVGSWIGTTQTLVPINSQSCVTYSNVIYCINGQTIGGGTNIIRSVPILPSGGLGTWSTSPNIYPCIGSACETGSVCGVSSNNIYCDGAYAPILSSGIVGSWQTTNSDPLAGEFTSCTTDSSYLYCMGGTGGSANPEQVYSAPIMSWGLGSWQGKLDYPGGGSYGMNCNVYSGNIYCVGGIANNVYYAPITSPGVVGSWQATTQYLTGFANPDGISCDTISNTLYCVVGGFTGQNSAYSPISGTGTLGSWTAFGGIYPTGVHPQPVLYHACVPYISDIYCIGGFETGPIEDVNYINVSTANTYMFSINPSTYNVPTISLSVIPNPGISGTSESFLLTVYNGIGPFNVEILNQTGTPMQFLSNVIMSLNTNAPVPFIAGNVGTFSYNAIATDTGNSPVYVFNSLTVNLVIDPIPNTTTTIGGGGGSCGPKGCGITSTTVSSTTTICKTKACNTTTTTIIQNETLGAMCAISWFIPPNNVTLAIIKQNYASSGLTINEIKLILNWLYGWRFGCTNQNIPILLIIGIIMTVVGLWPQKKRIGGMLKTKRLWSFAVIGIIIIAGYILLLVLNGVI